MIATDTSKTRLTDVDFLANVSHEIRNPLNTIIGLAHLLKNQPSKEEQEEYIQALLQTSENLLEIVNNIMDFSKLNSERLELEKRPVDLRKTINRSLLGQKIIAQNKNLDLQVNIDQDLPPLLMLDPVKLSQVIINLVSNAIKFTQAGSVSLNLEVVGQSDEQADVRFTVKDTGIGIAEDKKDNIFRAFDQGNGDINLNYGGTGLGLSISKSLIGMMGGDLTVNSTLGGGSEFTFILNFEVVRDPILPDSEETEDINAKDLRILLVDDNRLNRLVVQKNLERWQVACVVAENGREALEKVQQQDFDIVLMDLHMPEMDGFEAARAIRNLADPKYSSLHIIALSAATDNLYQEKIRSAGITDFLNKPFQPRDLYHKLKSYCKFCRVTPCSLDQYFTTEP